MNEDQHEPANSESEKLWREWKQHRRSQTSGRDFSDRVMTAVTESSVAGSSVAGSSVAGSSVAGSSVAGSSVAGSAAVAGSSVVIGGSNARLVTRIGNSHWARIGVCSAAMLVGMLPFLYLAVTAKIINF